ncbi:hypothetical protein DPEC_G00288800 [Dallia pectoralis]|uniref:Uncharacterized protein n=1 Tax=Dallia pectoralis TaxID=75939 RepID=A0ACC2FKI4_DALPE|nr:hypothetical protein DPEC_G00288800 [Dallia pectoralis]
MFGSDIPKGCGFVASLGTEDKTGRVFPSIIPLCGFIAQLKDNPNIYGSIATVALSTCIELTQYPIKNLSLFRPHRREAALSEDRENEKINLRSLQNGMEDQEPDMVPEVCLDPIFITEEDPKWCEGLDEETRRDPIQTFRGVADTNPQMTGSAHSQPSVSDTYRDRQLTATQPRYKEVDIVFSTAGEEIRDSSETHLMTSGSHLMTGSGQVQTHLSEMDDLLKSCSDITGVSFNSHLSTRYTDADLFGSARNQNQSDLEKMNAIIGSRRQDIFPSVSSYTDTLQDASRCQSHLEETEAILDPGGATRPSSQPQLPPLTSAGCQLSGTMAEYQTELMGMLTMLEKCMGEAGMTFDPLEWTYPSLPERYCHPYPDEDKWETQEHSEDRFGLANHSTSLGVHQQNTVGEFVEHVESTLSEELDAECSEDMKPYPGSPLGQFQPPSFYQSISTEGHMDASEDSDQGHGGENVLDRSVRDPEEHGLDGSAEEPGASSMEDIQQETERTEVVLTGSLQELEVLGGELEEYIEQVGRLEKRRDKLMEELQALREEKMETEDEEEVDQEEQLRHAVNIDADRRREARMREWQCLRAARSEEEMKLFRVFLERQGLQEETRRLKRRLFSITRDCTQNQVLLAARQRDVAQLSKEQEELDALMIQLTEEASQLRSNHQTHLSTLQSQVRAQTASQNLIPMEEITQSKRNSCGDIQKYLQSGLKSLEEWYEPVLLALLKRREGTSEALGRTRQQAQELRGRLKPLREEEQKLGLQTACLEERLKLMETQRRENIEQYKETVDRLEETSREQRMELQFQKRKNKEMEELRDSLKEEVNLYRSIIDMNDLTEVKENT